MSTNIAVQGLKERYKIMTSSNTSHKNIFYLPVVLFAGDLFLLIMLTDYTQLTNMQWVAAGLPLAIVGSALGVVSLIKRNSWVTKVVASIGLSLCLLTISYMAWVLLVVRNSGMGV